MANLTALEKRAFEKLFDMGTGYVNGFSNRTMQNFFIDEVGIDIYDQKYDSGSGSKANRLRKFWTVEPDHVVGKVMKAMVAYWKVVKQDLDAAGIDVKEREMFDECEKIADRLFGAGSDLADGIDAIKANAETRGALLLVKDIKDTLNRQDPELALDRLHTFMVGYVRKKCDERGGISYTKDTSLNALFGLFVKSLETGGVLGSEMSIRILKTSIQNLEAYNTVRNNQSMAHDNEVLAYEEAMFVCRGVINLVAFIEAIDLD